jgi:hypothetical protein
MARDAIARQYDVDKNAVTIICEPGKGDYRPGKIFFSAKKGRAIDLEEMRESIAATRLSGGTNMRVEWLEITVRGEVALEGQDLLLRVSGTGQELSLGEDPEAKGELQRLREARGGGTKISSVTGHVEGWHGRFPDVLKAQAPNAPGAKKRMTLLVTGFEVAGK